MLKTTRPEMPATRELMGRRMHVLVADDESEVVQSIRDVFEARFPDVDVHSAATGPEALSVARSVALDLVLVDHYMPGFSGLELLKQLRAATPDVPRILFTGKPDLSLAIQAVNEGGVELFLTKPLSEDALVEAAAALLHERRSRELRARAFARAMAHIGRDVRE